MMEPSLRKALVLLAAALLLLPALAAAQTPIPGVNITVGQANSPDQVATTLQIIVLLTVLTLAPAILVMTTSFTRLVIILAFIRQALGTQQSPPNQVLVGLALFLTFFIMEPVWSDINANAFQPYMNQRLSQAQALERAGQPLKQFMQRFVREKDLALFVRISNIPRPRNIDEVPFHVLVPAFIISELKTAFQIGFILYVPFLVVDLVVASVLMAMGMMMLPPIMISLPIKLMLFVLVDGWNLIIGSLVEGYFAR
jgi:flagellar biosynthetic protein FliP